METLHEYFTEIGHNQHWSREFAQSFVQLKGEQVDILFSLAYRSVVNSQKLSDNLEKISHINNIREHDSQSLM